MEIPDSVPRAQAAFKPSLSLSVIIYRHTSVHTELLNFIMFIYLIQEEAEEREEEFSSSVSSHCFCIVTPETQI